MIKTLFFSTQIHINLIQYTINMLKKPFKPILTVILAGILSSTTAYILNIPRSKYSQEYIERSKIKISETDSWCQDIEGSLNKLTLEHQGLLSECIFKRTELEQMPEELANLHAINRVKSLEKTIRNYFILFPESKISELAARYKE